MSKKSIQEDLFSDFAKRKAAVATDSTNSIPHRGRRVSILCGGILLWCALIVGRLYHLQLDNESNWKNTANKQHHSTFELASERGPILDRSGKLLAASVPGGSVFVRPRQVKDSDAVINHLSEHLGIAPSVVQSRLESESPFVWIARQVPRHVAESVASKGLHGVGMLLESRRYYPYGSAASLLLGKVGVDGKGLSGIEAHYNTYLSESPRTSPVYRDGVGNLLHTVAHERVELPKGAPLQLTLDASLQLILDEELERGREVAKAARGMAVLVNARTGEVLAMGQTESPNFNSEKVTSRAMLRNDLLQSAFEPGSVLKPLVAAIALEHGVTHFHELINCENGSYRYGGHTINDVHPSSLLSTYNVVVHSSNIGMTKLADRLGKDLLFEGLSRFGFGRSSGTKLQGESAGLLRDASRWYPIDIATHSFGQGVAVTPLQLVRAVSAVVNGGTLPTLSVVRSDSEVAGERILDSEIARQAERMMIGVVEEDEGTGNRAAIPGIRVGGKTGTAQKPRVGQRGYEPGAYIASFVGFADGSSIGVEHPLSLVVVMDTPKGGSIYGGTVAAPVFQKIMKRSLHYLSIQASDGYFSHGGSRYLGAKDFRIPNGGEIVNERSNSLFHLTHFQTS